MAKYVEFAYGDQDFVVYTYFKDNHKIKIYNFKNVLEAKGESRHYREIIMPNDSPPI